MTDSHPERSSDVPAALVVVPALVALGLAAALSIDPRDLAIIVILAAGPATSVFAAQTPGQRVLAGSLVAGICVGWWMFIGIYDRAGTGLAETGVLAVFGPCLFVPLIAATGALTILGVAKLYRQRD